MEFRTKVTITPSERKVAYTDTIVTMGSCFADSIGEKMLHAGMNVLCNPFGTLYNPCSIAVALQRLLDGQHYAASELVERDGLWHSFAHHGKFSTPSQEETLAQINHSFDRAKQYLLKADILLLTLGTAWVYERDGKVVANCHKFPDKEFIRRCMNTQEVTDILLSTLKQLKALNPHLTIVTTVSPIRHFRDGAHANQLSKSTLLLGLHALTKQIDNIYYFPAYELMMDELRDYRFYADDMCHPSSVAVQYIWEKFQEATMNPPTQQKITEGEKQHRANAHRPLH